MKQYQIAVLEGDGIGPEIIREGVKVLRAAAEIGGISLGLNYYPYGAEHYLKTGEILPDAAIREFRTATLFTLERPETRRWLPAFWKSV